MALSKITLAPSINIKWNPVTDDGQIRLDFMEFVTDENGKATSYADINKVDVHFDQINKMATRLANLGENFVDPVTGTTLPENISGTAVMIAIKRLTEVILEEKRIERIKQGMIPSIDQMDETTFSVSFDSVELPQGDSLVSLTVDWGDGNTDTISDLSETLTHTYEQVDEPKQYTISVSFETQNEGTLSLNGMSAFISPVDNEE